MHYFFEDFIGVTAACLLSLLLMILPGFGIASLMARAGHIDDDSSRRTCWGLLLGPTLLPAIDALLLRWIGFPAILLAHVALGAFGARPILDAIRQVRPRWWSAMVVCWLAAAWTNVDFDWNGRLYQNLFIMDGVKHAAVVGALAKYGLPLHDPFFARPGVAGYYYYFYIAPALIHWLGGALIDSRDAYAGATFITLLAFPAMLFLVADAAALIPEAARRRFVKLMLLLCCVSGLDLLPGVWIWLTTGNLLPQLDWWSEEVRWALTSVLGVPHHMTSVMAVYAGCLILSGTSSPGKLTRAALAGVAFATAFGCSVWVAVAAVAVLALWWGYERISVGTASMWALPLAALWALLLSITQIEDIYRGRTVTGPPLTFYMRPVGPVRVLPHSATEWIVHLAVTPGGYLIEFGIFAIGAIAFLTRGRTTISRSTPIGRLLLVAAPATLILVTFVRSAVIYNDFGWRAIWLAQVPAMLWTTSFLAAERQGLRASPIWIATLTLGLAATSWDLTGMRLLRPFAETEWVNEHPQVDLDLRATYGWINNNIPADVIVQHNPKGAPRLFDFGLYSDHPVGVADREAQLFGASPAAVEARVSTLTPIFQRPMSPLEVHERAASAGVGAILLTSDDPLWRIGGRPPRNWSCAYRTAHTCLMMLEKLQ